MARDDQAVLAEEARQALNSPAFQRAILAEEMGIVTDIANFAHSGSEADDHYLLELCRRLQTINSFKRRMGVLSDINKLTHSQRVRDV